MSKHLTPYEVCKRLFGSTSMLAEICGTDAKAPFHWARPSVWRDAGDLPSTRHMRALLTHASAKAIPLTAEHLIWGASSAEIEALLQPVRAAE